MSENTRSSAFRKIDVDQFNENFKDDEQSECQQPTAVPDESEITTMINQYPLSHVLPNAKRIVCGRSALRSRLRERKARACRPSPDVLRWFIVLNSRRGIVVMTRSPLSLF